MEKPQVVSVTHLEYCTLITIKGIIPTDCTPTYDGRGKLLSPDPLMRICMKEKKALFRKHKIQVSFFIRRITSSEENEGRTEIEFILSNTDPKGYKLADCTTKVGIATLQRLAMQYEGLMAQNCADEIAKYIDENYQKWSQPAKQP